MSKKQFELIRRLGLAAFLGLMAATIVAQETWDPDWPFSLGLIAGVFIVSSILKWAVSPERLAREPKRREQLGRGASHPRKA